MVERFDPEISFGRHGFQDKAVMESYENGEYVKYSDYQHLAQRLERAEAKFSNQDELRAIAEKKVNALSLCNDGMEAEIERLKEQVEKPYVIVRDSLKEERSRLQHENQRLKEQLEAATRWRDPEDLPNDSNMVEVKMKWNHCDREVIFIGYYARKWKEEAAFNDDTEWLDYSDYDDTFYYPEGWYECQHNWDEYSFITVSQGTVTGWRPIPAQGGE